MNIKPINRYLKFDTEDRKADSKYRCKYGDKRDFDVLEINIHYQNENATFTIESKYLPDTDSVHFTAEKEGDTINLIWSQKSIIPHIQLKQ